MKDDKAGIVERSVAYSLRIIKVYRELEKGDVRSHQKEPKKTLDFSLLTLNSHR